MNYKYNQAILLTIFCWIWWSVHSCK